MEDGPPPVPEDTVVVGEYPPSPYYYALEVKGLGEGGKERGGVEGSR